MIQKIHEALAWRFAVKQYDTTQKISEDSMNMLLESLRLAPSSFGMQPWKFLVINDPTLRAQLRVAAYDQPQVTDASHFIVLTHRTDINADFVNHLISATAATRGITPADLSLYQDSLMKFVGRTNKEAMATWATEQVYIALGFLLETAALLKIDASPMGGFNRQQFDEILGLDKKHLTSSVICALGYRSKNDTYSHMAKARLPESDVIEMI